MNVIEIKDPNLNEKEILDQIKKQIENKTAPEFAAIGPEILHYDDTNAAQGAPAHAGSSHDAFIDLMLMHQLEEPDFSSETPLIGGWIVRLRQLWNWMSTKWYVRPIIKQQSTVNGQIAILLLEMEAWINEKNQTITNLEARVKQLESIVDANKLDEQ